MDTINDNANTERVRTLINDMKNKQTSVSSAVGSLVGIMFIAAAKLASLSFITYIGFGAMESSFSTPHVSYLNTLLMLAGFRAFGMMTLDPIFSKKEGKK